MREKIARIVSNWKGLITVPIAVLFFGLFPFIQDGAAWGIVYLQKILFALICALLASEASWFVIKQDNSKLFEYASPEHLKDLTPWQRNLLIYWRYSLFCLVFVLSLLSL